MITLEFSKKIKLISIIFLIVLFTTPLWATQINNGEFTNDLSAWSVPSGAAASRSSNAPLPYTGSGSYLALSGINTDMYISQSGIAVQSSSSCTIYMYMKSATANNHNVRIEVIALVGDTYTKTHNETATPNWGLLKFKFDTGTATSLLLKIYPETGLYAGETTWFDGVNLIQYPGSISSVGSSVSNSAGHLPNHFYLNDSNGIALNLSAPTNFYPFDAFNVEEYSGGQWTVLTEGTGAGEYSKILTTNSDQVTGFRIHTFSSIYPEGAYTFRIKAARLSGTIWAESTVNSSNLSVTVESADTCPTPALSSTGTFAYKANILINVTNYFYYSPSYGDSIVVTKGGNTLVSGTDYTYTFSTGVLSISKDYVEGNHTFTVEFNRNSALSSSNNQVISVVPTTPTITVSSGICYTNGEVSVTFSNLSTANYPTYSGYSYILTAGAAQVAAGNALNSPITFTPDTVGLLAGTYDMRLKVTDTSSTKYTQSSAGAVSLEVISVVPASAIADDSLDFAKFSDSMTLDAATTIDMDTNSADLNFDSGTLYIDNAGNVGIGTIAPAQKLEVAGNIAVSGSLTAAGLLPSIDGAIDLGLSASIENLSGAAADSGTGSLTVTTSGAWTTYVDNDLTYEVEIDKAGAVGVATYKWSRDGVEWTTDALTTGTATPLENGLMIAFGGSGGAVNDHWDITVAKNTGYKTLYANTVATDKIYTPAITAENSGGTVILTGNVEITGNLTTQGAQTIVGGITYDSAQVIDVTSTEALLVRQNNDVSDVFVVDTTNKLVGINKTPTTGIALDVAGNADFSGALKAGANDAFQAAADGGITSVGINAGTGLITTSGNITTTGAGFMTSAGLITASNGMNLSGGNFSITDASNLIINGDRITLYGDGNAEFAGTVTQKKSIGIIPEYDNAAIRGDGADNFGTVSLKYYGGTEPHNYYEWTTNEPTTQDYDIVIRCRLPDGFSLFDTIEPIKLWNKVSDNVGTTAVTVTMLDTAGAAVPLLNGAGLKNTTWTESKIKIDLQSGNPVFTLGGYVTIIIKMFADQGDTVDIGELTLKGNW